MSKERNKTLNIRDFPADLYWKCKARAAQQKKTLKKFVEGVLRAAVDESRETKRPRTGQHGTGS
jgi:predicted HicB family RNase H-like nuclease